MKRAFQTFGLDFTDGYVQAAFFSHHQHHPKLLTLVDRQLHPSGDRQTTDGGVLRETFASMIAEKGGAKFPRHAVVTLPDVSCYLFTVDLPEHESTQDQRVQQEIIQQLPYSIDEIYSDFSLVKVDDEIASLQIAACPKTTVDATLRILEGTNIEAISLLPASYAALRALNMSIDRAGILVVFLNYLSTTILLVTDRGVPISMTSDALCMTTVIEKLSHNLRLNQSEAREAMTVCGLDANISHGVVRKILEKDFSQLKKTIESVISFAQTHTASLPKTLYLCGDGAMLRFLDQELASQLSLPVVVSPLMPDVLKNHRGKPLSPLRLSAVSVLGAGLS